MIIERARAVQHGKEIDLRWNSGDPLSRFFFSNGGGRKSLAQEVREWEFKVQQLNLAKSRIAEMTQRSREEGIAEQIKIFCKKYRVTPGEFEAMSALSDEDRSDLIQ